MNIADYKSTRDHHANSFSSWCWGKLSVRISNRQRIERELICEAFSNRVSPPTAFQSSGFTPEQFFQFREAFLKSGQPSIDAFLERRPDFLEVGKLAIAYCLLPYETEARLYDPDPTRGGDWYEYLSVKLNSSFEEFGKNKLSIITFKYDRSLEHYLLNSLINLHGKSPGECSNALEQIPIVHVYGQLGEQPYPQKGSLEYRPGQREALSLLKRAAAGIKLYHEQADAAAEDARKLLREADRICFMGFGYHSFNLKRLNIGATQSKWIIGTARGLIGTEVQDAENRLREAIAPIVSLTDRDNLTILKEHMFLG